jgi:TrmH family RNA methyltransferase
MAVERKIMRNSQNTLDASFSQPVCPQNQQEASKAVGFQPSTRYHDAKRCTVILCRPADIRNIGAVIRACVNFEISKMVVISDQTWDLEALYQFSSRAIELIHLRFETEENLVKILGNFSQIIGTTRRDRDEYSPSYFSVTGLRAHLIEDGEIAILFGNEKFGLSKDELNLCTATVTIPTSDHFASMNLSHAVAIVAYELTRPDFEKIAKLENSRSEIQSLKAPLPVSQAFYQIAQDALQAANYPPGHTPENFIQKLRSILNRANLDHAEYSFMTGLFKELKRKSNPSQSQNQE